MAQDDRLQEAYGIAGLAKQIVIASYGTGATVIPFSGERLEKVMALAASIGAAELRGRGEVRGSAVAAAPINEMSVSAAEASPADGNALTASQLSIGASGSDRVTRLRALAKSVAGAKDGESDSANVVHLDPKSAISKRTDRASKLRALAKSVGMAGYGDDT